MSEPLHDALQPVLERWTMGGAAAPLAPEGLRDKLGEDAEEAEIRLLVLTGQALGTLVVPEPAGELQILPDLPALPLPTMPDRLRPLAARALARSEDWLRIGLLGLLEARGHVVHPGDWMPTRTGTAPAIYAPWQDWLAGIAGQDAEAAGLAATWEDHGPATRRTLLAALRQQDPAAALAIVDVRISGEPAEQRLAMVRTLSQGLSTRDRSFLKRLATDRAPTVRTLAGQLLRRLGNAATKVAEGDDPARGILDFIKTEGKGLVRHQRIVKIVPIRNYAQTQQRTALMAVLDTGALADALGLEDTEVPTLWPWGTDDILDHEFANMLLATGSDAVVRAVEARIQDGTALDLNRLGDNVDRLSDATLSALAAGFYARNDHLPGIAAALPVKGIIDAPDASQAWRRAMARIGEQEGVRADAATPELLAIGTIVTARAARSILDALARLGLPSADPRLDTLRINAAL